MINRLISKLNPTKAIKINSKVIYLFIFKYSDIEVSQTTSKSVNDYYLERFDKDSHLNNKQIIRSLIYSKILRLLGTTLCKSTHGKPSLFNGNEISLANSGEYFSIVISDRRIGMDIEEKNKVIDLDLAKYFATEKEIKKIRSVEDTLVLWTRKEAYLKYLGLGLKTNPKNVEFLNNKILFMNKEENVKEIYLETQHLHISLILKI